MSCQYVATQDLILLFIICLMSVSYVWLYLGNIKLSKCLIWWNPGEKRSSLLKEMPICSFKFLWWWIWGTINCLFGRNVAIETGGKLSVKWDIDSVTSHCSYQIDCRSKEYMMETDRSIAISSRTNPTHHDTRCFPAYHLDPNQHELL